MDLAPLPPDAAVSVVVPARNAADTLHDAVMSALAQRVAGPLEVVVAVGPSADDTLGVAVALASADDRVRVVDNTAGTTPAGLNAGIAACRGDVVVRLDAHALLPAGYVARAVTLLRETGAANVGGRQVAAAASGFAAAVAAAMSSPIGSGGAAYRGTGPAGDVDTVYLGVFHRQALELVGGYDATLLRNQDYELNHRLRAAGGRIHFHPDLGVTYRPRESVRALWRQYASYGAWKRHVLRRHPRSLRLRQVVAPLLVLGLVAGAVLGLVAGAWWPLGLLVGSWLAVSGAGAWAVVRAPSRWPAVVLALAVMHLAWGVGFLAGRTVRRGGGAGR